MKYQLFSLQQYIYDYAITDKQTFEEIEKWPQEVKNYANENVLRVLVRNKSDSESKRYVSYDEGNELADQLVVKFIETIEKNFTNLEYAFMSLIMNKI